MKKILFYLILLSQTIPYAHAQIRLIGVNNSNNSKKLSLLPGICLIRLQPHIIKQI